MRTVEFRSQHKDHFSNIATPAERTCNCKSDTMIILLNVRIIHSVQKVQKLKGRALRHGLRELFVYAELYIVTGKGQDVYYRHKGKSAAWAAMFNFFMHA